MAIVTPACKFICYENRYLGENTWLNTGREKVMAIVTPACQLICYDNMYLGEITWLATGREKGELTPLTSGTCISQLYRIIIFFPD